MEFQKRVLSDHQFLDQMGESIDAFAAVHMKTEEWERASFQIAIRRVKSFRAHKKLVTHWDEDHAPAPPPARAEMILMFVCPRDKRDGIIGDMAEQFAGNASKHGIDRAHQLYMRDVASAAMGYALKLLIRFVMIDALLKKIGL